MFDCNFLLKERRKYLAYVEQLNQFYAHKTVWKLMVHWLALFSSLKRRRKSLVSGVGGCWWWNSTAFTYYHALLTFVTPNFDTKCYTVHRVIMAYGAQRTHLVHLAASLVNKRLPTSIKATARSNLGFYCTFVSFLLESFIALCCLSIS